MEAISLGVIIQPLQVICVMPSALDVRVVATVVSVSLHPSWQARTAVLAPADLVERLTIWIKRMVEGHLPLADAEL
jgi:hypothetical protein